MTHTITFPTIDTITGLFERGCLFNRAKTLSDSEMLTNDINTKQEMQHLIPEGIIKITLRVDMPEWLPDVISRMVDFRYLPGNWDSYGAKPVDLSIFLSVIRILPEIVMPETPCPSICPTNNGGIQLEWNENGRDLEVEFVAADRVQVIFEDGRKTEEREISLIGSLTELREMVNAISE
jgi:hypothetical protein